MMTVAKLIAFLETQPQHLPVAYCRYSEMLLLEADDIKVMKACPPRPDGWVHHQRPDVPARKYLVFPGN
jgi:hypothetical protein